MAYLVKPFQKKDLLPAIEMAASRFAELVGLEAEVTDLQGRLESRKIIERAKGVLQTEHGLTEPGAFRWIQKKSMDERRSMRSVAEQVLSGEAVPEPPAASPAPAATGPATASATPASPAPAATGPATASATPASPAPAATGPATASATPASPAPAATASATPAPPKPTPPSAPLPE